MTGEPGPAGRRGLRTLVVWCPDWPLVAAGIHPHVQAAVFHANRVVACTAAARAEGVTRGMRRREAQGRCPDLVIERFDTSRDARAFEPVVAAVEAFTPRVEVTRPGTCALPTRGPSRYFGGDEALAGRIRIAVDAELERLLAAAVPDEIRGRAGVADGPFTAAQAARRDLVVPPGSSAAFLAPLPVALLGEPDLTDLLIRLGLRTLGDLAALGRADVIGRFGLVGVAAHRRASGLDDRPLQDRAPPPELAVVTTLDPPADRVDTAAFAAKTLADRLCATLSASGLSCPCIRIEAETEHGEHLSRAWRHHRAFTPSTVAERLRWQLDGWLAERTRCGCPAERPDRVGCPGDPRCPGGAACPTPIGGTTGGLTLVRLVPEEVYPDDGHQAGFWGGITEADERAARGLARVQGLLGPESVMTGMLCGGRGPGERVRLIRWGDPRPSRRGPAPSETPTWPGRLPSPAPALVPVPLLAADLRDVEGAPVGVDGRSFITHAPGRLSVAGAPWCTIASWAGPWTADERWWNPATRRRLARVQVVSVEGNAFLLVLEQGRWWVEGVYD